MANRLITISEWNVNGIAYIAVSFETEARKLTVSAVYIPPRHNLKKADYKNLLQELCENFILGRDYNDKNRMWSSNLTNLKGKQLLQAIKERGYN